MEVYIEATWRDLTEFTQKNLINTLRSFLTYFTRTSKPKSTPHLTLNFQKFTTCEEFERMLIMESSKQTTPTTQSTAHCNGNSRTNHINYDDDDLGKLDNTALNYTLFQDLIPSPSQLKVWPTWSSRNKSAANSSNNNNRCLPSSCPTIDPNLSDNSSQFSHPYKDQLRQTRPVCTTHTYIRTRMPATISCANLPNRP